MNSRSRATPRFAILASGRGSNAVALIHAFQQGFIPAALAAVLCNKADAPVLSKAAELGVPCRLIDSANKTRAAHEQDLLDALQEFAGHHLLLAGYMRLLSADFLQSFGGSVLNIHPALLPDFPGLHAVERQWQADVKIAGATVHLVDSGVDTGPILLQGSLVVRGDEGGPNGLAQRILHEVEHIIYPRAVRLFVERLQRQK